MNLVNMKDALIIQKEITEKFEHSNFIEDKRNLFLTFSIKNEDFSFFRTFEFLDELINRNLI